MIVVKYKLPYNWYWNMDGEIRRWKHMCSKTPTDVRTYIIRSSFGVVAYAARQSVDPGEKELTRT